jgi:hypothetical protein
VEIERRAVDIISADREGGREYDEQQEPPEKAAFWKE